MEKKSFKEIVNDIMAQGEESLEKAESMAHDQINFRDRMFRLQDILDELGFDVIGAVHDRNTTSSVLIGGIGNVQGLNSPKMRELIATNLVMINEPTIVRAAKFAPSTRMALQMLGEAVSEAGLKHEVASRENYVIEDRWEDGDKE